MENRTGYTHLSAILEFDTNMDIQIHVFRDMDTGYLFSHFYTLVTWPPMEMCFVRDDHIVSIFPIGNLATNVFVSCTSDNELE